MHGTADFDNTGFSVSGAGDVNGDGIDDLITGTPVADPNGYASGASYVVFGSIDLSGTIDLADAVNGADLVIEGAAAYDSSGRSVSGAGDVNGDGFDDLIIGAPIADRSAGASYVIFGTDQALPAHILTTDADVIIQGAAAQDASGWSVSGAGDVNGDGIDDIIIGATQVGPTRYSAGASYVIFGTDQGWPATMFTTDADLIIEGAPNDRSGWSVSGAGDVNGDGFDDLIIGAPFAFFDPNGRQWAGVSYVIFGGPAAALERLIARVEAADLPGGLENSLTSKLESALRLLARDNTTGAIGKIRDFIDQVEAQRGKQIDEADADAWIAAAETILDMLSTS